MTPVFIAQTLVAWNITPTFMILQWIAVFILYFFPQIILALPNMIFGMK